MKYLRKTTVWIIAASFLGVGPATLFGEIIFEPAEGATPEILIEGTSTVTNWEVTGDKIDGQVVFPNGVNAPFSVKDLEINAEVKIPSDSLVSGRRAMDSKIRDALDIRRHPAITFSLGSLSERSDETTRPGAVAAVAEGDLTVAGATRLISFPVEVGIEDGKLRIEGEIELEMTNFGIAPPRAMLGALRTGDEVTVSFVWLLEPTTGSLAPAGGK